MPRLTAKQWEHAKADFEIAGLSKSEIARKYGTTPTAVRKAAQKGNWQEGKSSSLILRKTAAIKELSQIEDESSRLTRTEQKVLDRVVRTQLELDGLRREFHARLYEKGIELAESIDNAGSWHTLTAGARNLMPPQQDKGTTVNVNQQQAQGQTMTPEQVCEELIAQQRAEIELEAENGSATR